MYRGVVYISGDEWNKNANLWAPFHTRPPGKEQFVMNKGINRWP